MKGKILTLWTEISRGSQSVRYAEVIRLAGHTHTLRIDIESDSHTPQAHARIERWDGTAWKSLDHVHYGAMQTPAKLYYLPEGKDNVNRLAHHFEKDRNKLVERALLVLGVS